MNIPPELRSLQEEIRRHAADYGLDFFEVSFELLDWKQINEVASYGGFPNRYPHWRFGMEYERLSKSYAYGLSKIYEMVINNDPCYAYLLHSNQIVDQKLVMAHVYGHCDFFKNNQYFAHTNRKMMDEMANHRTRVLRYIDSVGYERVERCIDVCLSLENLIDYHSTAIKRGAEVTAADDVPQRALAQKFGGKIRPYMDRYINPPEFLAEQQRLLDEAMKAAKIFPEHPQRDVLGFLIKYAPLEGWERDLLSIIREEALYFAPQGQTKVMNEGWACVTGETRVLTDRGALRAQEIVTGRLPVRVFDGHHWRRVIDWVQFPRRKTIRLRTRRGYVLEGSGTHQILTMPNTEHWQRLDHLRVGDPITIVPSVAAWPRAYVGIQWQPRTRLTLNDIAEDVGVNLSTVIRHQQGQCVSRSAAQLEPLLLQYRLQPLPRIIRSRKPIRLPDHVDARLGRFLGYLIGDGHISRVKRVLGLTTADREAKEDFAQLGRALFGLTAVVRRDAGRWRVLFHSEDLADFLESLGMCTGPSARIKRIPEVIWQSPRDVVSAFLRAYLDADGYAGRQGVILSTFSEALGREVQDCLLRFGIISRRRRSGDGWHVHVTGPSAIIFHDVIGFGIHRKQDQLQRFIRAHRQWKRESWQDEVVELQIGLQDVYDFTVEDTHRYVAHGLINHNSYWHSTIMTRHMLKDHEVIDYADHHSGTVAMHGMQLNPYKIGLELFRDIEERWNMGRFGKEYNECTDMRARVQWDRQLGLGRKKIFEVRRVYNDVTFIDEFLTPEFCKRHRLFVYAYNLSSEQFEIADRHFEKIKKQLLMQLTNCGQPVIELVDANYGNRGELLLKHCHEGIDLRPDYARETLKNLYQLWHRPVNIESIVEGVPRILAFDGENHKDFRP